MVHCLFKGQFYRDSNSQHNSIQNSFMVSIFLRMVKALGDNPKDDDVKRAKMRVSGLSLAAALRGQLSTSLCSGGMPFILYQVEGSRLCATLDIEEGFQSVQMPLSSKQKL